MRGVILVLFVLLGNYIALVPALSRRRAGERAITVAVVSAVVQPGRAVSSTPADRPAHLADAALYQGSAAAQQHPPIHGRPERAAATHRVARQARTIHL